MKIMSIIEAILKPRSERLREHRTGRINDDNVESEYQESLKVAEKFERKTYDKYKEE